jgi:pimeloyl-ACP methyl ester carboxylesterase
MSARAVMRLGVLVAAGSLVVLGAGRAWAAPEAAETRAPAAAALRDVEAPMVMTLGKGEPQSTVIFMHGLGGAPGGYRDFLKTLLTPAEGEPAVRVVAIWMRSPKGGDHTMTDQLARARKVIDAEPGPVVLMGHSFGGKAALKLAAEYPEGKVRKVVALAPSVNMLQSYWKRVTGERVLPAPEVVDKTLARIEAQLVTRVEQAEARGDRDLIEDARGNLSYARVMRDLGHHDEPGIETTVTRPTLVLHGTDDEAVSIHYARRFAEANPKAVEFVELPGANHGFRPAEDAPSLLADMRRPIRAFLTQGAPAVKAPAIPQGAAAAPKEAPKVAPSPPARAGFVGRMFR